MTFSPCGYAIPHGEEVHTAHAARRSSEAYERQSQQWLHEYSHMNEITHHWHISACHCYQLE